MKKIQIGVIGPAREEYPLDKNMQNRVEKFAEEVGKIIGKKGIVLITGGMDGVMEAASRGAKMKNGITIGTPGRERGISNKYVDIEILTPIDIGDFLFVGTLSCDAFIVVPGSAGTMAELCLAYRAKKPIVILSGFSKEYDNMIDNYIDEGKFIKIFGADSPKEAVDLAIRLAKQNINKGGK